MNYELIVLLAWGFKITDSDIANELYEICDREHSSCNSDCPVYNLNGNSIPDTAKDFRINRGCDCFKNGREMLDFIRKHNPTLR